MGGDRSSLKYFIEKYGEIEGTERYNKKCEKLSKANKGKSSYMKGKKHKNCSKEKIRNSVINSSYHKNIKGKKYEEIHGDGSLDKLKTSMKGVFTIDWFIKKYGEVEGKLKYDERSKNISKTSYFREYNKTNKNNYSKISQELFWNIFNKLKLSKDYIYFAELNHEYSCGITRCNFDFVNIKNKKIIEFNGDKFHANPILYNENDKPNPYTDISAKDIWDFDNKKINEVIKKGYDVLVIWENDYKENKTECINKCLNFMKNY